jgi:hypothetical protein
MAPTPGETPNTGPDPNNPASQAFDMKAFKDELMREFSTALGGATQSLKKDVAKMIAETKPAASAEPTNPNPDPAADPANPAEPPKDAKTVAELNAQFQSLQKKFMATEQRVVQAEKEKSEERNMRLEGERLTAIDRVLADLPFPNESPKARQQFRDAYQSKVKRDEDGTFVVETDKGAISADTFLRTEFEDSPHFAAPQGHGGAGANAGKKPAGGAKLLDVVNMTDSEIAKAPKDLRDATLAAAMEMWQHPS